MHGLFVCLFVFCFQRDQLFYLIMGQCAPNFVVTAGGFIVLNGNVSGHGGSVFEFEVSCFLGCLFVSLVGRFTKERNIYMY